MWMRPAKVKGSPLRFAWQAMDHKEICGSPNDSGVQQSKITKSYGWLSACLHSHAVFKKLHGVSPLAECKNHLTGS